MVQIAYKGLTFLLVPGYKIVPGTNEIADADFYKLMNLPTFKHRVENKVIEVPQGFPLKKPSAVVEKHGSTKKPEKVLEEKMEVPQTPIEEVQEESEEVKEKESKKKKKS